MTFYNSLKILHILTATLLLTSMVHCCYLWLQTKTTYHSSANHIQIQTWRIIIPFALLQLATGFTMISIKQYNLSELWIFGSILGFIIVVCSWFGFLYFLQSQQSKQAQSLMLLLCSVALLCMIFLMVTTIS